MSETAYRLKYVWTISSIAALGGLLFGYDWVVIGGAEAFYEVYFGLSTPFLQGWAMSCALVGCLIGSLISGGLTDRFGRKRLLIFAGLLFLATGIGTATATTFAMFVLFRLLGGMGIGLASNISPMYIAEVSPAEVRGKFVSLNQLAIVIGILAAQLVNLGIGHFGTLVDGRRWDARRGLPSADQQRASVEKFITSHAPKIDPGVVSEFVRKQGDSFPSEAVVAFMKEHKVTVDPLAVNVARLGLMAYNDEAGWRWMFGAGTVPAILFFLAMFAVPESPRWLVKSGKSQKARAILARIGGPQYAQRETAEIEASVAGEIDEVHYGELLDPRLFGILALGVILAVFQQWCGINVIFNYAKKIFEGAGYGPAGILRNIAITGLVNLVFTFVAIYTVDRVGRRTLMLIGPAGLAGIYALIGACFFTESQGWHVLVLVVAAIGCYACSLAPVTWVVLSEIFPNRIRGAAMAVCVTALWIACFVLTQTFPLLETGLGLGYTFWLYGAICAAGFLYIKARLPETKGMSLEQIERQLT